MNDGIDQDCNGSDLIGNSLEELKLIGLSLYPNPAKDHFIIENSGQEPNLRFSLIDLNGKKGLEGSLMDEKNEIDISSLDQGMYFVIIQNDQVAATTRLAIFR